MMVTRRSIRVLVLLILTMSLLAIPSAALAQQVLEDADHFLVLTEGPAVVDEDTRIDLLVVTDGDVLVEGDVDTVVALSGDVTVTGEVGSTALAFDGTVIVEPAGRVTGDVYSSETPQVADGTVTGAAERIRFSDWALAVGRVVGFLTWLAASFGLLLLGLLMVFVAPRGVERARQVAVTDIGPAAVAGIGIAAAVPIAGVLLAITLIGIPTAVGLVAAAWLIGAVGYLVLARTLGGLILRGSGSPVPSLLLGLLIFQVVVLVPFMGGLVGALAWIYGLGVIAVTVWQARTPAEPAVTHPAPIPAPPRAGTPV
jgi:hypothetical protein